MIESFQFLYAVKEKIRTSSTLQFNPVYLQIPIEVLEFYTAQPTIRRPPISICRPPNSMR